MDMAICPMPVAIFAERFRTENKIPVKPSQKMGFTRGESVNEMEMTLGSCGMPQPPE